MQWISVRAHQKSLLGAFVDVGKGTVLRFVLFFFLVAFAFGWHRGGGQVRGH